VHLPALLRLIAAPAIAVCAVAGWACDDGDNSTRLSSFEARPTATEPPLEGGASAARPTQRDATSAASPAKPRELRPDLQTEPFRELFVEVRSDGARTLRFSTTVVNNGDGPLELVGGFDEATKNVVTTQRVHQSDGSARESEVGRFLFHPEHAHWHFEDFTVLEVWTEDGDGDLDEMVATTGKATFCAVDEVAVAEDAPEPAYLACGERVQGISRGWSDTYGAEISGQAVDLGTLPDGEYAIRSTVDPANRLLELDEDNNSTIARVELRGAEIVMR
jgi:hypothetical protein